MYIEGAPSCWTASTPKARKRHKCCECRGWIEPGEKYHKFSGIWDGEAGTYKTCDDCQILRKDVSNLCRKNDDEEPSFRNLCTYLPNEEKPRYVAIMVKRGAEIHPSWDKYRATKEGS